MKTKFTEHKPGELIVRDSREGLATNPPSLINPMKKNQNQNETVTETKNDNEKNTDHTLTAPSAS